MRRICFLSCLVVLTGCGGGGTGDLPPATHTYTQGSMQLQADNLLATITTNGSSVYAMTGNITNAIYNDLSPTQDETEIFSAQRATAQSPISVVAMSVDGTGSRTLCTLDASVPTVGRMEVSPAGTWLYLIIYQGADYALYRLPTAGGTPQLVRADCNTFSLTPSGAKIFYRKTTIFDGWYLANADGTGSVFVAAAPTYMSIVGCVSETAAWVSNGSNPHEFAEITFITGNVYPMGNNAGCYSDLAKTTGGKLPAWAFVAVSSVWAIMRTSNGNLLNGPSFTLTGDVASYHSDIAPSPLGDMAAVATYPSAPVKGISIVGPGVNKNIYNFAYTSFRVAWGPLIKARTFIGSGIYTTGAGAMLFSEAAKNLPAVVLADAVTRGTCLLTKISNDGNRNIIYRLDCDNLKKLHYSTGKNYALAKVVDAATGLKGAFISFDADSGEIASVTTFTRQPTVRIAGGDFVLEGGEVIDTYDKGGKSLGPKRILR